MKKVILKYIIFSFFWLLTLLGMLILLSCKSVQVVPLITQKITPELEVKEFIREKLFCPICQKDKTKSKVYILFCDRTDKNYVNFFDEDGNLHDHDPNVTSIKYKCSNGHTWTITTKPEKCFQGDFPKE